MASLSRKKAERLLAFLDGEPAERSSSELESSSQGELLLPLDDTRRTTGAPGGDSAAGVGYRSGASPAAPSSGLAAAVRTAEEKSPSPPLVPSIVVAPPTGSPGPPPLARQPSHADVRRPGVTSMPAVALPAVAASAVERRNAPQTVPPDSAMRAPGRVGLKNAPGAIATPAQGAAAPAELSPVSSPTPMAAATSATSQQQQPRPNVASLGRGTEFLASSSPALVVPTSPHSDSSAMDSARRRTPVGTTPLASWRSLDSLRQPSSLGSSPNSSGVMPTLSPSRSRLRVGATHMTLVDSARAEERLSILDPLPDAVIDAWLSSYFRHV